MAQRDGDRTVTRDEAVTIIKGRLGRPSDTTIDTLIINEMKLAQTQAERDKVLPWFLLTEISDASATINEQRLKVPTDFLREFGEGALWHFDDSADPTWTDLTKEEFDYLRQRYSTASGAPVSYALVGSYFRLFPTPDQAYTMKMLYYAQDEVLSTDIENQWLKEAPGILISRTGGVIARYLNHPSIVAFSADLLTAQNELVVQETARDEANRSRAMGDD